MILGLALIASGVIVLYALRRALWRRLDDEESEAPPAERVHYVGPEDDQAYDVIDIPLDGDEYGARPIYVPPERGTVYVSRTTERAD
jgi:hypothetical protein